jgi:hypothetical protein
MTEKQMFDALLLACKDYINSSLSKYTEETKELASFEKKHMERYSGGAPIDHVLFRLFLRRLNEIYKIDLGDKLLDVDAKVNVIEPLVNEINALLGQITDPQDGDLVRLRDATDANAEGIRTLVDDLDKHIEDFDKLEKELKLHYVEYTSLGELVLDIENDVAILKQKGIYKIVEVLPEEGDANIIYLVPRQDALDKNIKDEYMWIDCKWESIGTTSIDLADYTTKKEFNEVKQENVDLRKKLAEVESIAYAAL